MGRLRQEVIDILRESETEMTADDVYEALKKKGMAGTFYMVKRTLVHLHEEKKVMEHQPPPAYTLRR